MLGALGTWGATASASPTFPAELQRQLDMPCVPQCTLCHRDANGGVGTATRPFGAAMDAAGLELKRPDLIAKALASLERNQFDSDEDSVLDVEELRQGQNPNEAGAGFLCATYGCSAQIAPPRAAASGASIHTITLMLLSAAVAGRMWLRRRRLHRSE